MGLSVKQQIFEFVKNSQKILVVFKKNYSGDALSSALAIFLLLEKLGKKVDLVCHDFVLHKNYSFLPATDKIRDDLSCLKQFIISMEMKDNKIKDLSYEVKNDKLNIILTPQKGYFDEEKIKFKSGKYKYDLIITLDTDDLESLGDLYEKNNQFFYETPIINIDHNAENEQYGQINLVELTKSSAAEIVFDIIDEYDSNLLTPEIATCLLTGMISKTKSFRSTSVTPQSLSIASQLILNGADRDLIIQNLYRTKSINTLKLWGKVLARLKHDSNYKMTWSYLQQKDLIELNMNRPNFTEIVEELITSAPEAEIIILFYETQDKKIAAHVYSTKSHDSLHLAKSFNPSGNKKLATFEMESSDLVEAGRKVIDAIKSNL